MPAGVSWVQYLSFCAVSMVTMLSGAQVVHMFYKPLDKMYLYVEKEIQYLPDDVKLKIMDELREEGVLK